MKTWTAMLSGLLLWLVHFLGVYGLASAADMATPGLASILIGGAWVLTAACLAGVVIAWRWALTTLRSAFQRMLSAEVNLVAAVAIVFESVPLILGVA